MASITPYITKSGKRWRVQYRDPDMPDDAVADSSPEVGGTPDDYDV